VAGHRERVYQVFGQETLDQLIPLAAVQPLEHVGLPQPPPWRRDPESKSRNWSREKFDFMVSFRSRRFRSSIATRFLFSSMPSDFAIG